MYCCCGERWTFLIIIHFTQIYLFTEMENEIVLDFYFWRRKRCTVAVEIDGPNLRNERNMGARPLACKPTIYDSMSDLGEIRVYQRADFQSGSRVLKKVF